MGLLDIFKSKYVSEKDFKDNLQRQMMIYPKVLGELRNTGISEGAVLHLGFIFYTNKRSKAEQLHTDLLNKGYEMYDVRKSVSNKKWMINGQTDPVKMDVATLSVWSKEMCEIGYQYDCFFDFWDVERG